MKPEQTRPRSLREIHRGALPHLDGSSTIVSTYALRPAQGQLPLPFARPQPIVPAPPFLQAYHTRSSPGPHRRTSAKFAEVLRWGPGEDLEGMWRDHFQSPPLAAFAEWG